MDGADEAARVAEARRATVAARRWRCDLTEPVLAPLRRVIPPAGMFDLSFTVLFVVLIIVRGKVCT